MCEKGAERSDSLRALRLFYVPGQGGIIWDGMEHLGTGAARIYFAPPSEERSRSPHNRLCPRNIIEKRN